MIIGNKYYFLGTDLFSLLRVYVFSTLLLIAIFVVTATNIIIAPIITTLITAIKLASELGSIQVKNSTEILIKTVFHKTHIKDIKPFHYWWNYDFNTGSIDDISNNDKKWKSRSNKVIVNLILKNDNKNIHFKETITLDTRHPNDAIYLEEFENQYDIIPVQRIDKLMTFLNDNYIQDRFTINEKFRKNPE